MFIIPSVHFPVRNTLLVDFIVVIELDKGTRSFKAYVLLAIKVVELLNEQLSFNALESSVKSLCLLH